VGQAGTDSFYPVTIGIQRPRRRGSTSSTKIAHLFAQSLAREGLFNPFPLARFQIERVLLDILDDVFLLDLALEPAQGALKRFAIIQNNFRQSFPPPSTASA
jgi:hypothetical protein